MQLYSFSIPALLICSNIEILMETLLKSIEQEEEANVATVFIDARKLFEFFVFIKIVDLIFFFVVFFEIENGFL